MLSSSKYGYWFTYCLFQTFAIFAISALLMTMCGINDNNQKKAWLLIFLLSSALEIYIKFKMPDILETIPSLILSFDKTIYLMPFFYFGILCRAYYDVFIKIFENYWLYIISCILLISSYYKINPVLLRISGYIGIIVLFGMFYYFRAYFSTGCKYTRRLQFIGRNTLPIYLFHYFVIYYLGKISYIKYLYNLIDKPVVEFIVFIIISWLIAEICLLIDKLLTNYCPTVHRFVFGK